jgi:hypothetical protein
MIVTPDLVPVKKTEINDRGNPLRWPRDTLYLQRLALNSPTSGGRSVGIVRSRTKATEFSLVLVLNPGFSKKNAIFIRVIKKHRKFVVLCY